MNLKEGAPTGSPLLKGWSFLTATWGLFALHLKIWFSISFHPFPQSGTASIHQASSIFQPVIQVLDHFVLKANDAGHEALVRLEGFIGQIGAELAELCYCYACPSRPPSTGIEVAARCAPRTLPILSRTTEISCCNPLLPGSAAANSRRISRHSL